jgi:hypothetical protein
MVMTVNPGRPRKRLKSQTLIRGSSRAVGVTLARFPHSRDGQVEPAWGGSSTLLPRCGQQLDDRDRRLRPGTKDSIAARDQPMAMDPRCRDEQGVVKPML